MAGDGEAGESSDRKTSLSGPSAVRTKRTSTALPKAPTSLDATAVIANHAVLTGVRPITIGAHTVVHPHARIASNNSEVIVGSGCLILERACIGVSDAARDLDTSSVRIPEAITIGDNVTIESGSVIEAEEIGDNCFIDVGVRIGVGSTIGKNCMISACEIISPGESIPDYTVVYGNGQRRTNKTLQNMQIISSIKARGHDQHLKMLQRLIPSNLAKFQ